jgi:UDP-N-acetylglucosamine 2-epimerase
MFKSKAIINIICVCGARQIFMKIAPIMRVFGESGEFLTLLVQTCQHNDAKVSHLLLIGR